MIFVTVGTQLPFPRLIDSVEEIARFTNEKIVAQTMCSRDRPGILNHFEMDEALYERTCRSARLMIGHAGVGTILSAQRFGLPLVVVPRRASLGEHRTDHQIATAKTLIKRPGVFVDWNGDELLSLIRKTEKPEQIISDRNNALVATLRSFLSPDIRTTG